jgi:hypothetical protein
MLNIFIRSDEIISFSLATYDRLPRTPCQRRYSILRQPDSHGNARKAGLSVEHIPALPQPGGTKA